MPHLRRTVVKISVFTVYTHACCHFVYRSLYLQRQRGMMGHFPALLAATKADVRTISSIETGRFRWWYQHNLQLSFFATTLHIFGEISGEFPTESAAARPDTFDEMSRQFATDLRTISRLFMATQLGILDFWTISCRFCGSTILMRCQGRCGWKTLYFNRIKTISSHVWDNIQLWTETLCDFVPENQTRPNAQCWKLHLNKWRVATY